MTGQAAPIHRQLPRGAVARWEQVPRTTRPRRIGAVGQAVPRRGESVGPTALPRLCGSGGTRLDRDGILRGIAVRILGRLALSYAILARLRNCPGVSPTRRLK